MRRMLIAAAAATALFAGVGAASAQNFQYDGPDYYAYRGPMVERGVGLQVGPVGVYADQPAYYDGGHYGYQGRARAHDNSTYNSNAFRSQEIWPQSPPGGGY